MQMNQPHQPNQQGRESGQGENMNPIEAVKYIFANGRKDQNLVLKLVLFLAGLYFFVIAPLHLYLLVTS